MISLETLPTQSQAAYHHATMKETRPSSRYLSTYLCYATYALNLEQNSGIGITLTSLSRTRLHESYEGGHSSCGGVTWTSAEAYVSFLGTDSELHVYKFRLCEQSPRQLREGSHSTHVDRQDKSHQRLVVGLPMDFIKARGYLSVQFFPDNQSSIVRSFLSGRRQV